jgi:pimeloyl-ACP methyl ester carboxylesterase
MPTVDLPQGRIAVHTAGPQDSAAPPVVLLHGFLVDASLWSRTAEALAAAGVRSYAPDLPLGSHREAMAPTADLSPRGVAGLVLELLAALGLEDVTLVGNDSGGAIAQFAIDLDPSRVGRLVLTNCDAFEAFPPAPFDVQMKILRREAAILPLLTPLRATAARHSPAAYGMLARDAYDPEQTRRWIEPALADAAIRRDIARFVREVRPADLVDVCSRHGSFERPVSLVWGTADRFFKLELAQRLRDAFPDAQLVEVPGARTFVALDEPQRVADEIVAIADRSRVTAG